jgi:hypothetical protein
VYGEIMIAPSRYLQDPDVLAGTNLASERTAGLQARAGSSNDNSDDLEQNKADVMTARAAEIKLVIDGVETAGSPGMTILEIAGRRRLNKLSSCGPAGLLIKIPHGSALSEGQGRRRAVCLST